MHPSHVFSTPCIMLTPHPVLYSASDGDPVSLVHKVLNTHNKTLIWIGDESEKMKVTPHTL